MSRPAPLLDPETVAPDIYAARHELPDEIEQKIKKFLRRNWNWNPAVSVVIDETSRLAPRDIEWRKVGGRFELVAPLALNRELKGQLLRQRASYYLLQFSKAEGAERMAVTLSDGHVPGSYRFSPSSVWPWVTLLPDPYFFRDRGYEEAEAAYHAAPAWDDRDDRLIWRGAPNGAGMMAMDRAGLGMHGVMPRCRLVLMCMGTEIDAGFVIPKRQQASLYEPQFAAAGMTRPRVEKLAWANQRYALDIDGHSNAWDNFMIRLKLGCCVLKVESFEGYRQWYYDRLEPWEHFVPVRADMSDLFEKYDWVRSYPVRAKEIAAAGRAVAAEMTLEAEWAEGSRRIAAHWSD